MRKEGVECIEADLVAVWVGVLVSYADFVIVGFLQFIKRCDPRFLDRVVGMEPAFGRLFAASEGWLARDT